MGWAAGRPQKRGECPRSVSEGDRQQPVEWSFQRLYLCAIKIDLRLKIGAGEFDRLAFQREQGTDSLDPEILDQIIRKFRIVPVLENITQGTLNETVVRIPSTG